MIMQNQLSKKYIRRYRLSASKLEHTDRIKQYNFVNFVDKSYLNGKAKTLLDVACGDGALDGLLKKKYAVTGIDKDKKAILTARKKIADVKFILGDMQKFRSSKKFDIILCVHGLDHGHELRQTMIKTIKNLSTSLNKSGVIIFDVNFLKELWDNNGTIIHILKDKNEKWVRVFHQEVNGHTGTSYFTTLLLKRNKIQAETSKPHESTHLLNMYLINKVVKEVGFNIVVYEGWTSKKLRKVGKMAPVIVLIKE